MAELKAEILRTPKVSISQGSNFKVRSGTDFDSQERVASSDEGGRLKKEKTVKIMDALMIFCLCAISFGIPIFFTGFASQGIIFEKQIYFYFFVLLSLVAWLTKGVIEGEIKIRKTPLDVPIIGFLGISILATIFSVNRWSSFLGFFGDPSRGLTSIISLILFYYTVFSNFQLRMLKYILVSFLTSNFIMALWVFFSIMNLKFFSDVVYRFVPASPIGSFSGAVIFFAAIIPLIMTALFKARQNISSRILRWTLVVFFMISLILNLLLLLALYAFASWTGWLAILTGVVLFLIYTLSRVVRLHDRAWSWLPMAVFGVIIFFLLGGSSLSISRVNLPLEISLDYPTSLSIARSSLKDNFFLGSGPATYGYNFSLYKPKEFNLQDLYGARFYQGSGLFFEIISTLGILGIFFFILITLSFFSVGLYLLTREKEREKIYSLGLFSSSVILIISLLTIKLEGSLLIIGAVLATFSLVVVLKESMSEEKCLNLSLKASPKFALAFAFVFTVVSAGAVFLFVYIGKIYAADIMVGVVKSDSKISEESVAKILKGINLNKRESRYYVQLAQTYSVLANNEALKTENRDLNLIQTYLNNSMVAANQADSLTKNDIAIAEALAQVYENSSMYAIDSLNLAEDSYRKSMELDPNNPDFLLKIGQIKLKQAAVKKEEEKKEAIEEARNFFQASVDKKDNFSSGHYQLALAKEALDDLDGAIDSMGRAYVLDRNNINGIFHLGRLYQMRGKNDDYKIAEASFKRAMEINDKESNVYLQLGLLYEKMKEEDRSVAEYEKALDLIPENEKEVREKIQEMINKVQDGAGNVSSDK